MGAHHSSKPFSKANIYMHSFMGTSSTKAHEVKKSLIFSFDEIYNYENLPIIKLTPSCLAVPTVPISRKIINCKSVPFVYLLTKYPSLVLMEQ